MVQIADSSLKLVSGQYKKPGLFPMLAALVIGFGFSAAWLTLAGALISTGQLPSVLWGVMIALCALLYCSYMSFLAYQMRRDLQRQYVLEISASELILITLDRMNKQRSTQMVLLDDVKYAEYYPYTDSSCLILHSAYTTVEIPLWPLGEQSQDVIDFLVGRSIPIMNVQFDDKIPQ